MTYANCPASTTQRSMPRSSRSSAARNEGSLCLTLDVESLTRRLPNFPEREALITDFMQRLRAEAYHALIAKTAQPFLPLVVENNHLYFLRYHRSEQTLRDRLHAWLQRGPSTRYASVAELAPIIAEVLATPAQTPSGTEIRLNAEQQRALALSLLGDLLVITGGPGTGKTAIIFTVLRCLLRQGLAPERIALT